MGLTFLAGVLLAASMHGQVSAETAAEKTAAAERLDFMRTSVEPFRFSVGGREAPIRLRAEPAFRMGKQPADIVQEGAIFLWLDDIGRPEATVQVFEIRSASFPQGLWIQEFVSLSPTTFVAEERGRTSWAPTEPGVAFRPVPGAPTPADTATLRTRQMNALAREFHASDDFKKKGWIELRLLTKPIARYGKPGSRVVDGAMYAFATGTDPEAFLFLEAREEKGTLAWEYAFAPMTCFELKGTHKGQPVWTLPNRENSKEITAPYFLRSYRP